MNKDDTDFMLNRLDELQIAALLINLKGMVVRYNACADKLYHFPETGIFHIFSWCNDHSLPFPIKEDQWNTLNPALCATEYTEYNTIFYWDRLNHFIAENDLFLGGETLPCKSLLTKLISLERARVETVKYARSIEAQVTGNNADKQLRIEDHIDNIRFHLESIIDQLPVSIYWKSADNVYVRGNQLAADIAGVKKGTDLRGVSDEDLAKKFDWTRNVVEHFTAQNNQVLQGHPVLNHQEVPFKTASGKVIHQITNRVPLRSKNNTIIGILGVSVDITDRIKNELIEKNNHLEAVVAKYKQFLNNQEHDMRTPHVGLISAATALLSLGDEMVSPDVKKILESILSSAQALLDYNDSLLVGLSLSDDNPQPSNIRFRWLRTVQRIFDIHKISALNNNIEYTLTTDKKIPEYIIGDEERLQHILLNLISNAFRFTSDGHIHVAVTCLNLFKDTVNLRFSVEDTGVGIPKDKQFEIYQPFYKLKPSNQGGERGRGLGLSLVKKCVEDMNGELALDSIPKKGSEFRVILPFKISLDQTSSKYEETDK